MLLRHFGAALVLASFAKASEIAILPNAKLVMDGSELPEVKSDRSLKIDALPEGKQQQQQQRQEELPETIEDVEPLAAAAGCDENLCWIHLFRDGSFTTWSLHSHGDPEISGIGLKYHPTDQQ
eukprot:Skav219746  [mRNA]  locus=scaffold569:63086:63585:+ [translate_table: standard]